MIPRLPPGFPSFVLPASGFGHWWRVHGYRPDGSAWWFASCDEAGRAETQIGRFDLPLPHGTCYVAAYGEGAAPESLRATGVDAKKAQCDWNKRRLSQMPLDRWYGEHIADFTSGAVRWFGAPQDIAALTRAEARPWAIAAHEAEFRGILYRLREDPHHRVGLALFGEHGDHPPANQPPPTEIVTGLRNDVLGLFDGEYRGDPLFK